MLHDTVTVTRTKALVTAPTALAISRAVSHGRQIQPHYTVGESAADQIICDVLDEHYDAAGGIPFQPANLIHNHRNMLDFELHCTGTTSLFAADIWQFKYADWVHASVSVCSRAWSLGGTIDLLENRVYLYPHADTKMFAASSRPRTLTMPVTTDLDTLLFEDSNVVAGHVTGRVACDALARDVNVRTLRGPDIDGADWNTPTAGTDLGFDAVWTDGVVRGVYEFHRQH